MLTKWKWGHVLSVTASTWLPQVKEAEELEKAQRVTEENKAQVHEELLRKAVQKEVCVCVYSRCVMWVFVVVCGVNVVCDINHCCLPSHFVVYR